jgi:hypothetical protein
MRPQLGVHLLKHPEKIRADAVHFIDKGDAWHPVFVSLVPDSLGLWFDAPDGAENRHCTVEHTQRALNLDREVHMTGGIDNSDCIATPLGGHSSGGNTYAPLALLWHPVGDGFPIMDLAQLMRETSIE